MSATATPGSRVRVVVFDESFPSPMTIRERLLALHAAERTADALRAGRRVLIIPGPKLVVEPAPGDPVGVFMLDTLGVRP